MFSKREHVGSVIRKDKKIMKEKKITEEKVEMIQEKKKTMKDANLENITLTSD